MNTFWQHLQDPGYLHTLVNPVPVYGLAVGVLVLALALILRSKRVTIAALVVVFVCALSAWPIYHYGQAAYDRVKAMSDPAGEQWLDEHMARGEKMIWLFNALAGFAAMGVVAVLKWPRASDQLVFVISVAGLIASCGTNLPPLPANNPADPQVRSSSRKPRDLLAPDETTLAIQRQLAATQAYAESAEQMKHDMTNTHGMQHGGMKMEGHEGMAHRKKAPEEKKALQNEMRKTSDEMKATSDAMKKKSDEMKTGATVYTCPMHPHVRSDKPGNCAICGMKLKKAGTHEEH